jgi:hypothetical protein
VLEKPCAQDELQPSVIPFAGFALQHFAIDVLTVGAPEGFKYSSMLIAVSASVGMT